MDIKTALENHKVALASEYTRLVQHQFDTLVGQFGPDLKGASGSFQWCGVWDLVADFIKWSGGPGYPHPTLPNLFAPKTAQLDPAALEKGAARYADQTIRNWADKIEEKVGQLEGAEVRHLSGFTFEIVGRRAGRAVRIEQTLIVNVSSRGLLFNQFPARIYVNGKFTSAAKFKNLEVAP